MLGYDGEEMREFFRGYLSIHSDYEGGNISTHTGYLVGSALSDPYLSYAAAVNSLAGPLYGLTSQEGFKWLLELKDYHKGMTPNKEKIIEFTNKTL
jgi:citrate synthase